jgi:hypothetical protein
MSWDRESLWAKSVLYFDRAFRETKDEPMFGFWASLGLELLVRSAVAAVSPALLADPDPAHKNLLHALGRATSAPKSLAIGRAVPLCTTLHEKFTEEDQRACNALINRRNEELHSGTAAFASYPTSIWLAGFYQACKVLAEAQGETLEKLFGAAEAANAIEVLRGEKAEVKGKVESEIAAHKRAFEARMPEDKEKLTQAAHAESTELSYQGHHLVTCPACGSAATVIGEPYGDVTVTNEDDMVVHRQPVAPQAFRCTACGLSLHGYPSLDVAGLAGRYKRTSRFTPQDYYAIEAPEPLEPEEEYDNE